MILNESIAEKTAQLLLQIKAIKLKPQQPFTWSSGWKAPIYCDNRVILSYPGVRDFVKKNLADSINDQYGTPDAIAGVATGGIGIGALVAEQLDLPFAYVRPESKKHGRRNQIEGHLQVDQDVVVIEDLISTGKSSLNAVNALKRADVNVKGLLAIFSYGFELALENFERQRIDYKVLSNYGVLLREAVKADYLEERDLAALKNWRENPANWQPL